MSTPPRLLHEPLTANTRNIALFGAGLVVFLALSSFGLWTLYSAWLPESDAPRRVRRATEPARLSGPVPAAPLSSRQRRERLDYEAEQKALLSSYGWVDDDHEFARVPLERAMELMLQGKQANR